MIFPCRPDRSLANSWPGKMPLPTSCSHRRKEYSYVAFRLAVREIHLPSRCQNLFPHAYMFVRATTPGQILPFQKFKRRASATRKRCHLVGQAKPANCPGN